MKKTSRRPKRKATATVKVKDNTVKNETTQEKKEWTPFQLEQVELTKQLENYIKEFKDKLSRLNFKPTDRELVILFVMYLHPRFKRLVEPLEPTLKTWLEAADLAASHCTRISIILGCERMDNDPLFRSAETNALIQSGYFMSSHTPAKSMYPGSDSIDHLLKEDTSTTTNSSVNSSPAVENATLNGPETSNSKEKDDRLATADDGGLDIPVRYISSPRIDVSSSVKEIKPVKETAPVKDTESVKDISSTKDTASVKDTALVNDTAPIKNGATVKDTTPVKNTATVKDTASAKDTPSAKETSTMKDSKSVKETVPIKDTSAAKDTPLTKNTSAAKDTPSTKDTSAAKDTPSTKDAAPVKDTSSAKETTSVKETLPETVKETATPIENKPSTKEEDKDLHAEKADTNNTKPEEDKKGKRAENIPSAMTKSSVQARIQQAVKNKKEKEKKTLSNKSNGNKNSICYRVPEQHSGVNLTFLELEINGKKVKGLLAKLRWGSSAISLDCVHRLGLEMKETHHFSITTDFGDEDTIGILRLPIIHPADPNIKSEMEIQVLPMIYGGKVELVLGADFFYYFNPTLNIKSRAIRFMDKETPYIVSKI